jgi:hypothetical protein
MLRVISKSHPAHLAVAGDLALCIHHRPASCLTAHTAIDGVLAGGDDVVPKGRELMVGQEALACALVLARVNLAQVGIGGVGLHTVAVHGVTDRLLGSLGFEVSHLNLGNAQDLGKAQAAGFHEQKCTRGV